MLSKKTQYALQALSYMVEKNCDNPILIAEIANKKNIPIKFLENILLELRKAGFLESKKGKHGGYFFAQVPEKIKLSSIFRVIEGPIALLPCVSLNFYEKCADCNEKKCGINKVMAAVRDNTLAILDNKTVADLSAIK
ncbi:MAG: Rrf2 family transcriptional regulator [Chitinophagia bacterium]|jgi:Rrf2 family protein|nr:Rrf2 family transcriptional regulator [Chitinophagia bacterium]NCA29341.1 Rrf2 family transcriptional regulator [Chitinophagia bacterium]